MIGEAFRKYLEEAIGSGNALVAFSAFDSPASVSVRKNPFKEGMCPEGREVPWCRHGRILPQRPQFTLDPHFHAGAYYVQDFIPICIEEYDLIIPDHAWDTPMVRQLIATLKSDTFKEKILSLGGYTVENPGEIIALS